MESEGSDVIYAPIVSSVEAMREALETMGRLFDNGVICTSYANSEEEMEQIEQLYWKTKAALSVPLRHCERYGTRHSAEFTFLNYYNESLGLSGDKRYDAGDLKHNVDGITVEFVNWLLEK